jgi:hypothetical protein
MRLTRVLPAAVLLLGAVQVFGQVPDAAAMLAKAREALGGEKKLATITSFVATGQTRQIRGDNLIPIEFEINVELPDRYSRRDETPAVESGYSTSGFNGDGLVQLPPLAAPPQMSMPARPGGPPPPSPEQLAAMLANQRKARVIALKQDFTRLTLGMFAASFPAYPLTFTRVGIAESPQGKADVIEAKGPDNFTARLFINQETHLPVMLTWMPPARPGAPAAPENRLYFADYRDVNGLQWPFRLRRAVGADTIEETTFDRYRLNVKIDPRKFEVVK